VTTELLGERVRKARSAPSLQRRKNRMNVVKLEGGQSASALEPQPAMIKALEEMLADAKAGRIQHLVAVFTDGHSPPTDLYQGSGEPWHVAALIGGMELCKHTMLMTQYHESVVKR
jgi:hypothetical protein